MDNTAAWGAESREALAAVAASAAALVAGVAAFTGAGAGLGTVAGPADPPGADRPHNGDPLRKVNPLRNADSLDDADLFQPAGPRNADPLRDADPLHNADPLRGSDPLRDVAEGCLDGLAGVARLEARMAALKVRLAADYLRAATALAAPAASPREHTVQEMALVAEVAGVLTVSERAAGALLAEAHALTTALPLTLAALGAGTISWAHARVIIDETQNLDRAGAAGLEAHFLDPGAPDPARGCPAGELTASRFRAKARTWRERHHRDSLEARHARSAADRRVEYVPDRDGMAWLSAYLPADTAAGIWDRATTAARALQGPDEARTLAQLRADITATWLLTTTTSPGGNTGTGTTGDGMANCGPAGTTTGTGRAGGPDTGTGMGGCVGGGVPSPRAQVLVTVPVLSLLGVTGEPAVLDGYGPIPPSMARRLVAEGAGSFYRVLVDPRDGAPLEIGRSSYRVTKAQRHWLRLRDSHCTFTGCNNHSLDNDADHLLAWADGGTTGIANLGQPCPKHHRLKHSSAWQPVGASKTSPPGWISPSGRHYPAEHQDWEPPHWPDHTPATHNGPDLGLPLDPGLPADPKPHHGPDLEQGLPPDPGLDRGLPPDPFPDWHHFTAAHPLTPAETDHPDRPAPLDAPFPDGLLILSV
ncbi:HNH endonuclease signature motif containing protein [Arthrobacter sp. NicSoilB8]|uniref:HNH endonuclease signature motif containing protein n=1 Tax=Arthrobacter sp. NicSoilB8 TaxID=2830998 RepID=UPI001CC73EB7|nr:HNH endonuclease signature motif containing protein [Arthrobacter sp. NicSoilB8]BCW71640.1 hypothetical protein NicSoilB8_26840 [Arthrobacter sp. NicSoilB8]